MTIVSSYFSRVGIDVNKADFARVDRYFDSLQRRLLKFQTATGKLTIDVKPSVNVIAASKTIQRQITQAMAGVTVPLRKFQIDGRALAAQISGTLATKGGASRIRLNATLSQQSLQMMRQQVQNALNGMIISPRVRPVVAPVRGQGAAPATRQGVGSRASGNSRSGSALYDAQHGTLARLSRFGLGALPFVAGAYGLSALNDATKEVTQSRMAANGLFSNAVMPDGSVRNVADSSKNWLRNHTDTVGLDRGALTPSYLGFMAAGMSTMGYEQSQNVFGAFSKFGTVRGATAESMQRALVGVAQMAGKGTVMSEELQGQIVEHQGFGELGQIFAQAYQKMTGGNLTGSKAYSMLRDEMKKGKVMAPDLLPFVMSILDSKSDPLIAAASKTTNAEQNRAKNATRDFTEKFASGGGDAGWATIWRTVASMTERASANADTFGRYFEIASLYASNTLLTLEQMGTWLTGNAVGDNIFLTMFGPDTNKNIQDIIKGVTDFTMALTNMSMGDATLASTKAQLEDITNIIKVAVLTATQLAQLLSGDWDGAVATGIERNKAAGAVLGFKSSPEMVGPPDVSGMSANNPLPLADYRNTTGAAPTPYANTPVSAVANTTNNSNQNISVVIQNPIINARPDQTVSQALAELVAPNVQVYTNDLRGAMARAPNGPQ